MTMIFKYRIVGQSSNILLRVIIMRFNLQFVIYGVLAAFTDLLVQPILPSIFYRLRTDIIKNTNLNLVLLLATIDK